MDDNKVGADTSVKATGWSPDGGAAERHPILDDPELEGLTLYEKKAFIVNRELDSHGMGRYQWFIWWLCGMGFFIDLLSAQAFNLVEPSLQQEFGFGNDQSGNIFSSFHAGLTAGAFVWGVMVDIIGRRWAFNLTVLIASIFTLCLAAPDNYNGVLVLAAFVGIGVGGNVPIDTTICLEFIPQDRRFLLALLSVFQPLGVMVTCGIAAGLIPKYSCGNDAKGKALKACSQVAAGQPCCTKASNMGWRYTMLCIGAICMVVFLMRFVLFRFQESPKFYLYRGEDAKAVQVLHNVAKFNKRECSVTLDQFEALTNDDTSVNSLDTKLPVFGGGSRQLKATFKEKAQIEFRRYLLLFETRKIAILTVLVWITYAFYFWGFSIAGGFLPKILLVKNSAIHVSKAQSYKNFVLIYFPGIFGVLLGAAMYGIPRVGRKWAMIGSSALMGVSLFLYSTVNTEASSIGLNLMEYFFQSMFGAVLYGWTPEAYPAPIRGTACGVASFWGRLFSIVSPLIAAHLLDKSINGPLYLAGSGVFVCTIALFLMPSGYMGARSF